VNSLQQFRLLVGVNPSIETIRIRHFAVP
jgi:hypothetical protein